MVEEVSELVKNRFHLPVGEEDRAVINRLLQAFKETPASLPVAPDVALLEPIVVTPKDRDSRVGTILLKPC